MAPLERDAEVEARDEHAEAEGPVRAGESRAMGTHEGAEDDETDGDGEKPRESTGEARRLGTLAALALVRRPGVAHPVSLPDGSRSLWVLRVAPAWLREG